MGDIAGKGGLRDFEDVAQMIVDVLADYKD